MEAKQTPLIDLLENVPRDAVLVVEHDQFSAALRERLEKGMEQKA